MTGWARFWSLILSPATARFILALLAVALASYALYGLMNQEIVQSNRDAMMLALGLVLGLSTTAFGYYFGSTARGDDKTPQDVTVTNPPENPVPTTTEGDV
jgi:hypothetical protein